MTEERQPNTELREKAKQWLLANYPGRNYEQDVVAVKDMAAFAATIQEEFEHEFDERTKLIGKLREAEKQLAEARIELEAAEQRGDEYKAALAEARVEAEKWKTILANRDKTLVEMRQDLVKALTERDKFKDELAEARAQALKDEATAAEIRATHHDYYGRKTEEYWDEMKFARLLRERAAALERAGEEKK